MVDTSRMDTVTRPDQIAFHRPLRLAVTALILVGAALAALAAILSLSHHLPAQVPAFAAVMLVLVVDAVLVWRQIRWAMLLTLAVLGGQAIAVAAIIVELTQGIADIKAHQLQRLGFNPTTGVIINLIYSSIGCILFAWFAGRWLAARRQHPSPTINRQVSTYDRQAPGADPNRTT